MKLMSDITSVLLHVSGVRDSGVRFTSSYLHSGLLLYTKISGLLLYLPHFIEVLIEGSST